MATIKEHDRVVLTVDIPEERLTAGDVGVVLHIHEQGNAYEVEFVTLDGATLAVLTLKHDHVRPVGGREITHARHVA